MKIIRWQEKYSIDFVLCRNIRMIPIFRRATNCNKASTRVNDFLENWTDLFCILLLTLIATFFVFTCSFLIVRVYFTVFIIPFIVLIKVIYFIPLFFYNSILCLFDLFLFLLVKFHFLLYSVYRKTCPQNFNCFW